MWLWVSTTSMAGELICRLVSNEKVSKFEPDPATVGGKRGRFAKVPKNDELTIWPASGI